MPVPVAGDPVYVAAGEELVLASCGITTPGWLMWPGLLLADTGAPPSTGTTTPGGATPDDDDDGPPTASMAVILAVTAAAATAAAVGMEVMAEGASVTLGGVTACKQSALTSL